jgi:hypothetical protein
MIADAESSLNFGPIQVSFFANPFWLQAVDFDGLVIVTVDTQLCNFFTSTRAAFQSIQPISGVCPLGMRKQM